jgi:hypothetical protein
MNALETALRDGKPPGMYLLVRSVSLDGLQKLASELGFRLYVFKGAGIVNKEQFFQGIANAMEFPSYFGFNWDAVYDCITDLDWWCQAKGYLLLYDGYESFANEASSDFEKAISILRGVIEHWVKSESPMYVLLRGDGVPSALADCPFL